jgi:hypothetical protein
MTSRISSTSTEDPRDESQIEARLDEVKEAYIEGEITEYEFDELLDASLAESAPYLARVIRNDNRSMDVPTPRDHDEEVYQNRGQYFTIDGNLARLREPPDWENVVNVTGNRPGPDESEVRHIERDINDSREAEQKREELRRKIIGTGGQ